MSLWSSFYKIETDVLLAACCLCAHERRIRCRLSCCRQCVSLVEQIAAKQTHINANLLRKVALLEKILHTKSIYHHQQQHQQQQQPPPQPQYWWRSHDRQQDRQRMQNDAPAPGLPCKLAHVVFCVASVPPHVVFFNSFASFTYRQTRQGHECVLMLFHANTMVLRRAPPQKNAVMFSPVPVFMSLGKIHTKSCERKLMNFWSGGRSVAQEPIGYAYNLVAIWYYF